MINLKCPPKKIRKTDEEGNILEEEDVSQVLDGLVWSQRVNEANKMLWEEARRSRMLGKPIFQKNVSIKENLQGNNSDGFDLKIACSSKNAICEAYNNGSVKLKFTDRTILTFDPKSQFFSIMTRLGEQNTILLSKPGTFAEYLAEALEF